MRLNLARVAVALGGALGVGGASAMLAAGCGGDDTTINPGPDGSKVDVYVPDVHADNYQADNYAADVFDAGLDSYQGQDVVVVDAYAPSIGDFIHQQDEAYCQAFGECCLAYPGNWNQDGTGDGGPLGCAPGFDSVGGINFLVNYQASLNAAAADAGFITYNPTGGGNCITGIGNIYVNSTNNECGVMDAGTINSIHINCETAIVGLQGNGSPCITSLDCSNGYCQFVADAGTTCAPLVAQGQPCSLNGPNFMDEQCSYLGLGTPARYCDFTNSDGGTSGVCNPALASGSNCGQAPNTGPNDNISTYSTQCLSLNCVFNGTTQTCIDNVVFSDPGVTGGQCSNFVLDAGGD